MYFMIGFDLNENELLAKALHRSIAVADFPIILTPQHDWMRPIERNGRTL